jgi:hypothetical protein
MAEPLDITGIRGEQSINGDGEDPFLTEFRQRVTALAARADALHAQWQQASADAKRYERALALMTGEASPPARPGPGRARQKGTIHAAAPRGGHASIGEDKLAEVKANLIKFITDSELDEFRQVDFRRSAAGEGIRSGTAATAFEILRQQGFLRLARADGNQKFFRLTREGLREVEAAS